MTLPDEKKDSFALKTFKRKKVIVIKELAELLASSLMTARRRLKQWHTHTSYSHNGRYYVLHDVAKFDKHGLWQYKDIFFSKYGNLRKTVIHLVKTSASGLAAVEIGELVGLEPWSFLSHFHNEPQLKREKVEGRFVYFSADRKTKGQQEKKRQEEITRTELLRLPTDSEAVVILVERTKHPDESIEDLSMRLRKKGYRFSVEGLQNFFGNHGLLKKTSDTQR
jgi:hypothetical protein